MYHCKSKIAVSVKHPVTTDTSKQFLLPDKYSVGVDTCVNFTSIPQIVYNVKTHNALSPGFGAHTKEPSL